MRTKFAILMVLLLTTPAFAEDAECAKTRKELGEAAAWRLGCKAGWEIEREKQYAEEARRAKLPNARIGMTSKQVISSTNWGPPDYVNRTVTAAGVEEQWVYGSSEYLYFTGGKLKAIHTQSRTQR